METLKIFISGTQDDLQPERRAVADVVRALGHDPVMAETYGTQPMPSFSVILEMVLEQRKNPHRHPVAWAEE